MCNSKSQLSFVLLAVAILAATGTPPSLGQCELEKLVANDGAAGDRFGTSVAISGEVALIGAQMVDHVGFEMGAAYVFRPEGPKWLQEPRFIAADAVTGKHGAVFGALVAIDGDTAVIGAPGDHLGPFLEGIKPGSAYVFEFDGLSWVQRQKLLPDDGEHNDAFGTGLAIDGDTIVIGSRGDDDNGDAAGSAYFFQFDGAKWVQRQKILGSTGGAGFASGFGFSVALDGDSLVIGAPWDDVGGLDFGAAYTFRFDGSKWNHEQVLLPGSGDGGQNDGFGKSVAVDAGRVVIGANGDDDRGQDSGSAFVFRFDPNTSRWFQEQKLQASDGVIGDNFGRAVAVVGATALIGAYLSNDAFGSAYVFRDNGSSWVETDRLRQSDFDVPDPLGAPPFFGLSLAMDGDTAVIGALTDDNENGGDAGAAYVFVGMSGIDCNENNNSDACDILEGTSEDTNGNGIPDECEGADFDGGGDGSPDRIELSRRGRK